MRNIIFKSHKAIDFCDDVRDGTHDSPKHLDSGKILITSKNIKGDIIDFENISYISEEDFNKINERSLVEKNDILYSMIGTIGLVYRVDCDPDYAIKNMGLFKISNELKSKWLYYFLKTPKTMNMIYSKLNGSTQKFISLSNLRNLEIEYPEDENDAKRIVKLLESIDYRIRINSEINNNLYEMGDNLYNEYFGKYKDNLPSDYKIVKLNEVADNYDSKRKPMSSREREQHRGIYPYYGATSIIDYIDDYIFDDIYLLMGEDGTVKTNDGYPVLQYIWGKNWINNHAHVLKGKNISTELLMFALRKINIENIITGAVQPKINQENMNKIEFVIGSVSKNKELEDILKNLMDKSKNIIEENKKLEELRDELLPKLMNGEIDLDNIEI